MSSQPGPKAHSVWYLRFILLGIIILIALQVYTLTRDQPQTIRGVGFLAQFQSDGLTVKESDQTFSVSRLSVLSGAFTATNGVSFYIMTSSEFSDWSRHSPTTFTYQTGRVDSQSILTFLVPGSYYLVFYNDQPSVSTTVTITESFVVSAI